MARAFSFVETRYQIRRLDLSAIVARVVETTVSDHEGRIRFRRFQDRHVMCFRQGEERLPPAAAPWTGPGVEVMKTELDKFYGLIDEIETVMMTTRRPDGHLESRPMANQKRADGADLWFVTAEGSDKLRDILHDPHVNLAYYNTGSYEWVSASGLARMSKDSGKIHELYAPDWKAWFGQEGDARHGTADDPRIVLIGVDVHAAVFLEVNKPKPVILFELAKGWLTGKRVEPGETHELSEPYRQRRPM
jgi:general stress protein 26